MNDSHQIRTDAGWCPANRPPGPRRAHRGTWGGHCCRTLAVKDAHHESMWLDGGMSKPMPKPARNRTANCSASNAALRKRGSLPMRLDREMAWHAPDDGRPGCPPVFSNVAIQSCLSIKVPFNLPLRQTAGMAASLLRLAGLGWPVPDDTILCRRQKTLKVQNPYRRAAEPAGGQPRHQVSRRWRVASPEAGCSEATPMAQGPSGHGHRHIRQPRGRVHPHPPRPSAARTGPAFRPGRGWSSVRSHVRFLGRISHQASH